MKRVWNGPFLMEGGVHVMSSLTSLSESVTLEDSITRFVIGIGAVCVYVYDI